VAVRDQLGVDVGGTFTDLVVWNGSQIRTAKVPTTSDQSEGVISGALEIATPETAGLAHGTTAATNALLERKGAPTALVTSPGFADVIEIGRQNRPSLYDTFADRPAPLVAPSRRFEVDDPATAPPDLGGAEAVAVSLIHGYRRADEEEAVAAAVAAAHPGVTVSRSSRVAAEFREFERTSTTVLNAYLTPVVGRYLRRLVERAAGVGLAGDVSVMRSSGGMMAADEAAALPAAILLSGPAGGVIAAAGLGELLGMPRLVTFDMGGTSTDVCRVEAGRPEVSHHREIDGYACLMPSVAVHTVGAGGGSLGWIDPGGSLRVGPSSAGAVPGPACYGRGGRGAAVTDANVVLGRIDPGARLAGRLPIRADLAAAAVAALGEPVGLDPTACALGMLTVVEEVMAGALRRVSLEEGADPRDATLLAFGGAGGLHATALARRLDMAGVVVPPHAGVFSALGLLLSSPRVDRSRTVLVTAPAADRLDAAVAELAASAMAELHTTAGVEGAITTSVDVRYVGQSHELTVPYDAGDGWEALARRFHERHYARNGFALSGDPVEAVTIRAAAVGDPALQWSDVPPPHAEGAAAAGRRRVVVAGGEGVDAAVVRRGGLRPGDEVVGPAIVEESQATTFLGPGDRARVHEMGALEVEW
jgi:N-methylhydantoinase A